MADSFFGFDTSLSNVSERDDGGGREGSEDEYDALNDETFGGSGEEGDWEQQHEELSMLTESDKHQSDLEAFLSHLVLEEYDEYSSEATSPCPTQPSALPNLAQAPPTPAWMKNALSVEELERNMMRQQQSMLVPPQLQKLQHAQQKLSPGQHKPPPGQHKPPPGQHKPPPGQHGPPPGQHGPPPGQQPPMMQHPPMQQQQHANMPMLMPFFQNRFPTNMMPPPMMGHRPPFLAGPPPPMHPFGNFNQLPPNKMPPGLLQRPPHTMTNLQAIEQQQQQNNIHHMNMNHQMGNMNHQMGNMNQPMTNMNPPMGNMNQPMGNMNQPMVNMNHQMGNMNQPMANMNHQMGNMNQPMGGMNQPMGNMNQPMGNMNQQMENMNQPMMNKLPNNMAPSQQHPAIMLQNQMNLRSNQSQPAGFKHHNNVQANNQPKKVNGTERVFSQEEVMQIIQETHPLLSLQKFRRTKTLDEFMGNNQSAQRRGDGDQYGGLMSQREKQWLLNIQLMQLNTGTPYMDDYYYTVFLDRQAKKEKQQEMKEAHKANQQNHPFSQQNLNNIYERYNANSGEGKRERRNTPRSGADNACASSEGPRHYVPTQFENSLGKLQCGSVTAPRKIMDMEVVSESSGGPAAGGPPRQGRQTLLAIEALYRHLLLVEDLSEPLAIANALVLKEREEKQRLLQGEEKPEGAGEGTPAPPPAPAPNRAELLAVLLAKLLHEDRLASFLTVRKGKLLVSRILACTTPVERWRTALGRLWPRLLRCLPLACRRDAPCLAPLLDHFSSYLNGTEGWAPVSDLCTVLTEESSAPRAGTPAMQRGLMHFLLTTQLGLSLLVALMERAGALPRPAPPAWGALLRSAARQALRAPAATHAPARPARPLPPAHLAALAAPLAPAELDALEDLLC